MPSVYYIVLCTVILYTVVALLVLGLAHWCISGFFIVQLLLILLVCRIIEYTFHDTYAPPPHFYIMS